MRGLYAIVDVETLAPRGLHPVAFAEAVLSVRPAALQLRAKHAPAEEILSLLRAIAPLCRAAGVPLVANDRPDLAALAGCPLVHVGQTDMDVDEVRRVAPGLGVGLSTHTLDQLHRALTARPVYVAFGPVFRTSSKPDAEPVVGVDALRAAHTIAAAARIPLVAIGGITLERAASLVGIADAVAVIGALVPGPGEAMAEVSRRSQALHALFAPPS